MLERPPSSARLLLQGVPGDLRNEPRLLRPEEAFEAPIRKSALAAEYHPIATKPLSDDQLQPSTREIGYGPFESSLIE